MKLTLLRYRSEPDHSLGILLEGECGERGFLCYTLEDEYRKVKVPGRTRVPAGKYKITLRTVGGFHERYGKRFAFHRGMLWLRDVPGFEYILIHCGNTAQDTEGCILVGSLVGEGRLLSSVDAYSRIYPPIADALVRGEDVTILVIDYA